jgi:hypothetical protein
VFNRRGQYEYCSFCLVTPHARSHHRWSSVLASSLARLGQEVIYDHEMSDRVLFGSELLCEFEQPAWVTVAIERQFVFFPCAGLLLSQEIPHPSFQVVRFSWTFPPTHIFGEEPIDWKGIVAAIRERLRLKFRCR